MNRGVVSTMIIEEIEEVIEQSLRPNSLAQMIGRDREKRSVEMMINSAKIKNKSIDHILFHGPPGLGKTSFAHVIAKEMGVHIHITNGTVLDKTGDLAAILSSLEPNSILFIDEIHRLNGRIEEMLYPAMEDKVIDIIVGKGPSAKSLRIDLPDFTLIGATTKIASISAPLRDRFGAHFRLDFYSDDELAQLIEQKAKILGVKVDKDAAFLMARSARMTARIAIRILKRAIDISVVDSSKMIDLSIVQRTLELLGIDDSGLDQTDRKIIEIMYYNFDNKPVGLKNLAMSLSEDESTIEDVYEPYLIKSGYIKRTPKGRVLTSNGEKLLIK